MIAFNFLLFHCLLLLFLITNVDIVHSFNQYRLQNFPFNFWRIKATESAVTETEVESFTDSVITLSPKAVDHLKKLKKDNSLYLRMGVKSGGCSGMSYVMDVIKPEDIQEDDHIETVDDINCIIDPKSLLFLFGLKLDYSEELIGGGFKFSNPNAETACGCGKSFGV